MTSPTTEVTGETVTDEQIRDRVMQLLASIKPRRPYIDDEPAGYLESDNDWMENNAEALCEFMDLAAAWNANHKEVDRG